MTGPFARILSALRKIANNPQLIYTVVIAVLIVLSFVFMASRFIGIANDAQERLVNVRIGSLQDAFVSFAADHLQDPAYLDARIAEIARENETIRHFRVVQKRQVFDGVGTSSAYIVAASDDPKENGGSEPDAEFLYSIVQGDPGHSITTQVSGSGERFFNTARAITDGQGNVLAVAMTVQTLSQADKAIERDISNSIYLLVAVIALILLLFLRHSRIIDYMDLYRRLKEVDQLKDDFISMASHELRTPLTIIRGYADVLRVTPDLPAESLESVARIDSSAKNLDALISDMLDVSRIEQGRMTLKLERFDPKETLAPVVQSFEMLAKEKGIALKYDAAAAPAMRIEADRDRLRQILVNLIGNAVKYTKKGEVEISQYEDRGRAVIRIRDTGIGIRAEDREKLFEKFYRIRSKDTEGITGTGLGLWITAELARQMRGTISVESIVGVGTHFIVSFPAAA